MERKLKDNPEQFLNIYSREAKVLDINKEERTAELVVATEQPVVVFDWAKWEPIREIVLVNGLRHPASVIMLDTHSRWSTNDIKGSIKDIELKKNYENLGTVKTGVAHFSKTAEKEWTLRQEGHLTDSSIGYRVSDSETVVISAGSTQKVQGKEYKNDYADGLPLVIRTGADLLEVSLVPIGADQAAKFRSMFVEKKEDVMAEIQELEHELKELINEAKTERDIKITLNQKGENKMDLIVVNEEKKLAEEQRVSSIDALTRDWKEKVKDANLEETAKLYKASGKSAENFADHILKLKEEEYKQAAAKPTVLLTGKEKENYSLSRAISSVLNGQNSFELEISQEYARQSGRKGEGGKHSFFLPHNAIVGSLGKRDVNTTATTGGEFVGTDHLGAQWIDVLRNQMVLTELGVTYLPGRKGNIEIPKLSSANTFGWAATENAVLTESIGVTTEVTLSPKRGGTFIDISKTAIIQSDPALDVILTMDGQAVMARGFDKAGLHGAGSGGAITGVKSTTNVNSDQSFASLEWQGILNSIKEIKAANAALSPLKFVTNAAGEALLRGREKASGYPQYLMDDNGLLAGRPCLISEQVDASHVFLGAWNQAYMAFWDALDITVDPYSYATYFLVRITFNQLADFAVRYPEAFFYADDLS